MLLPASTALHLYWIFEFLIMKLNSSHNLFNWDANLLFSVFHTLFIFQVSWKSFISLSIYFLNLFKFNLSLFAKHKTQQKQKKCSQEIILVFMSLLFDFVIRIKANINVWIIPCCKMFEKGLKSLNCTLNIKKRALAHELNWTIFELLAGILKCLSFQVYW